MQTFTNFSFFLEDFIENFNPYFEQKTLYIVNYAEKINPKSKQIANSCLRLVKSGGKRIRPALVYLGFWLANGKKPNSDQLEKIFTLGSALEFLHTFALIHDDIIDKASTRRGEPTIEAEYYKEMGKHNALTAALLAGDYLHTYADKLILETGSSEIQKDYYNLSMELICGQIDDCLGIGTENIQTLDEKRIIAMLASKSGNYTIQKPLLLGMKLAKEENLLTDKDNLFFEKSYQIVSEIGQNLGVIFQHVDDVLGIFGAEETGKPNDSDIKEGKRTLLMMRVLKSPNILLSEKSELLEILGNSKATKKQILQAKNIVKKTMVVDNLLAESSELVLKISDKLNNHFKPSQALNILENLGYFLVKRTK